MSDEKEEKPKPEFTDLVHATLTIFDKKFELYFRMHNLDVLRSRPSLHDILMGAVSRARFVRLDLDEPEETTEKDLN